MDGRAAASLSTPSTPRASLQRHRTCCPYSCYRQAVPVVPTMSPSCSRRRSHRLPLFATRHRCGASLKQPRYYIPSPPSKPTAAIDASFSQVQTSSATSTSENHVQLELCIGVLAPNPPPPPACVTFPKGSIFHAASLPSNGMPHRLLEPSSSVRCSEAQWRSATPSESPTSGRGRELPERTLSRLYRQK